MFTYNWNMSAQELNPAQQFEILSKIWNAGGQDGFVFLPFIPGNCSREERRWNWNEGPAFEWADDKPAEKDKILRWITDHQEDELYFTPAKFLSKMRKDDTIDEGWVAFADLDEVPPEMIDKAIRPTILWESSPGRFQAVWVMRDDNVHAYDAGGINQRLTYYLGADQSGWDGPQVLRVPGKPNYKPEYREENNGKPVTGRLMWSRSVTYEWAQLDQHLPSAESLGIATAGLSEIEDEAIESVDRLEVWGRVRLKVSKQVRDYMAMKPSQITKDYDRSEIEWQISRDLADAGCTVAEIIAIIQTSPWNKYAGRGDELFRLKMGALRAKAESDLAGDEEALEGSDTIERPSTPLWFADVISQRIPRPAWLVHNIWAKGSVGFIAGQPKSYKSYIGLDMAISVASGKPFLNDPQFSTRKARTLYLQEEDSLPIVIHRADQIIDQKAPEFAPKGQLHIEAGDTAGRGRERVTSELSVRWEPPVASLELALHVRTGFVVSDPVWQLWLMEFITEHQFELVVIDTLGTTVGDIDTDKAGPLNDRVLRPLKAIADATGCAIAVIHHNRKSADNVRSGQQMLGSVALHAWIESALYVQSKDTVRDGLYEVKVERENKLAEDMKFRIRIPHMWQEKGPATGGARQLWEPEVLVGWGDVEREEKAQKDAATPKKRQPKKQGGLKLAERMAAAGYGGKAMMLSEITQLTGLSSKQAMVQLKAGVFDKNWEETEDGAFIPLSL